MKTIYKFFTVQLGFATMIPFLLFVVIISFLIDTKIIQENALDNMNIYGNIFVIILAIAAIYGMIGLILMFFKKIPAKFYFREA